jgi:hypothetical protein
MRRRRETRARGYGTVPRASASTARCTFERAHRPYSLPVGDVGRRSSARAPSQLENVRRRSRATIMMIDYGLSDEDDGLGCT